jgi:hypothetical protein
MCMIDIIRKNCVIHLTYKTLQISYNPLRMGITERGLRRIRRAGAAGAAVVAIGGGLAACTSPGGGENRPSSSSASTPSSTSSSPEASPTPTGTTPATPTFNGDAEIKQGLQIATEGQHVILENPLIGSIARFPWEGGNAIVATVSVPEQNSPKDLDVAAFALSSDCIFEALDKNGQLGESTAGVWRPHINIEKADATVIYAYSFPFSETVINVNNITVHGEQFTCEEETALDRLGRLVQGIFPN